MRKFLLALVLLPSVGHAAWFAGSGPDFSQGAGNTFYCASTGTVVSPAGISISSPTITLWNPPGSGKRMTVLEVGVNVNASPAAAADFFLSFSTGVTIPSTATATNYNGFITQAYVGGSTTTTVGYCLVNANVPTVPRPFRYLGGTTGASGIGGAVFTDHTYGLVVIPPGVAVSLQSSSAASLTAHILEREDPQ